MRWGPHILFPVSASPCASDIVMVSLAGYATIRRPTNIPGSRWNEPSRQTNTATERFGLDVACLRIVTVGGTSGRPDGGRFCFTPSLSNRLINPPTNYESTNTHSRGLLSSRRRGRVGGRESSSCRWASSRIDRQHVHRPPRHALGAPRAADARIALADQVRAPEFRQSSRCFVALEPGEERDLRARRAGMRQDCIETAPPMRPRAAGFLDGRGGDVARDGVRRRGGGGPRGGGGGPARPTRSRRIIAVASNSSP